MLTISNTTDKVFHLRDGRALGYAEYGDPAGKPVFFFHGLPGSRLQRHPDDSIARELGAHMITIDRPGYGLSDFQPGRKLLDWPGDVAQLVDALKIDQFAPWGFRLEDIHKKIHLWHGEEDTTVPLNLARYVARTLPDCEPRFYPGEGHTLIYNYWREILAVATASCASADF